MHALADYGMMHVKLYEDIARLRADRDSLRLSGHGQ
jgi:alpha-D-ribose 1-methylphosphonate 5-phosphate C-P lyase